MKKKKLFIIYHSQSETTTQLVEAAAAGAALESDVELIVKRAFDADVFFDDQEGHCESARNHVATGHVPHGVANQK